ncbi:MAG: hypothetical protein QOJ89_982 [bacterium]|jgi:hypothetical protein
MSGFWAPDVVRAALVGGLCSIAATVPATIVALRDPKPAARPAHELPARDCVDLDNKVMAYLGVHHRLRAIYAQKGDAATSRWHLAPLATKAELAICENPERQVEAEYPAIKVPPPGP